MWNNIRHVDDNSKSSALHRHLIQSNSDSGHIQGDMNLINNISNEITYYSRLSQKPLLQ